MAFGSSFQILTHFGKSEFFRGPFFLVIWRVCADLVLGLFSDKWACFCSNSTSFSFSFQVLLASTVLVRLSTEGIPIFLLKYRAEMILAPGLGRAFLPKTALTAILQARWRITFWFADRNGKKAALLFVTWHCEISVQCFLVPD